MKPINMIYMCKPVLGCIKVPYLQGEIFVPTMDKYGSFINYAISNYGRLYSFYINKLVRQYIDNRGYHRVRISNNGIKHYIGIHYLELMSFQPIINTDIYIPNHKDGNPGNNMLYNLEWMTISENTRHAIDLGMADCKCDHNSRSVLTNEQVHYICSLIEKGLEPPAILDILNIPCGSDRNKLAAIIRLIRRGQTYLDISSQYSIPGIKGVNYYPPEITKEICERISKRQYRLDELCDEMNISLQDRKMFANTVQDITRRQKDTYIVNQYPILYSPLKVPKSDPNYKYYY